MSSAEPPADRPSTGRLWRYVSWIALACVAAFALTIAVRAGLTLVAALRSGPQPDIETQWDQAISGLGVAIEPVYPPEEDLAVGDVFVSAVDQYGLDSEDRHTVNKFVKPFHGKSVKLGHADVGKLLITAYDEIPMLPDPEDANGAGVAAEGVFGKHAQRKTLPRAAFPGLTITQTSAAGAGGAQNGLLSLLAKIGASREQTQKLILRDVETYGLDYVTADQALTAFCGASEVKVCDDKVARRYLSMLLGEQVLRQHRDAYTGANCYDVSLQVIMVNRIFLAGEILEELSLSSEEGGSASAIVPMATPAPAASATPASSGAADSASEVERRLRAVESRLASASQGGVIGYRASSGSQILLDQKLSRPVAFGYRSVKFNYPAQDPNCPSGAQANP